MRKPQNEERPPIVAAITAAGASERMGTPKALLPWADGSVLADIVGTLRQAEVDPILVITGSRGRDIAAEAARSGAHAVSNGNWRDGRFASIQAAARCAHAHSTASALLLWPVDCPGVRVSTVRALLDSVGTVPANVVPVHQGRRGHPILLCADTVATILRAPRDSNLRELLRNSPVPRQEVEVLDPSVGNNLNVSAEYDREHLRQQRGAAQ